MASSRIQYVRFVSLDIRQLGVVLMFTLGLESNNFGSKHPARYLLISDRYYSTHRNNGMYILKSFSNHRILQVLHYLERRNNDIATYNSKQLLHNIDITQLFIWQNFSPLIVIYSVGHQIGDSRFKQVIWKLKMRTVNRKTISLEIFKQLTK